MRLLTAGGRAAAVVMLLGLTGAARTDEAARFDELWYDGNAEIATYDLTEMRYGQPRRGHRVMVVVTEPLRLTTYIKPDTELPEDEKVRVIKLNDSRYFATGVYNYSVQTSLFRAVEDKSFLSAGDAVKVSFAGTEWCGNVFERMVKREKAYRGVLYSYFESEGEGEYAIDHADGVMPEENLWLAVRELRGSWLAPGKTRTVRVIPSIWSRRKSHRAPAVVEAVVRRDKGRTVKTVLGRVRAHTFGWTIGGDETTVTVEAAYPHRILAFTEPDGTRGRLLAVKRVAYWKRNRNADLPLRDELKLPR